MSCAKGSIIAQEQTPIFRPRMMEENRPRSFDLTSRGEGKSAGAKPKHLRRLEAGVTPCRDEQELSIVSPEL